MALQTTVHERRGGDPGIHDIVAAWYPTVLADPLLHPLFGAHSDDTELRLEFGDYLEFGTEVAVVNSHATSDTDVHPCQEVPRWP